MAGSDCNRVDLRLEALQAHAHGAYVRRPSLVRFQGNFFVHILSFRCCSSM